MGLVRLVIVLKKSLKDKIDHIITYFKKYEDKDFIIKSKKLIPIKEDYSTTVKNILNNYIFDILNEEENTIYFTDSALKNIKTLFNQLELLTSSESFEAICKLTTDDLNRIKHTHIKRCLIAMKENINFILEELNDINLSEIDDFTIEQNLMKNIFEKC